MISNMLRTNTTLTSLDLSGFHLKAKLIFGKERIENKKGEWVGNFIGDEGAGIISVAFKSSNGFIASLLWDAKANTSLTSLNMGCAEQMYIIMPEQRNKNYGCLNSKCNQQEGCFDAERCTENQYFVD